MRAAFLSSLSSLSLSSLTSIPNHIPLLASRAQQQQQQRIQLCLSADCKTTCAGVGTPPPNGSPDGGGGGGNNGTGTGGTPVLTITDVYQTSWDGTSLFTQVPQNDSAPIQFLPPTNSTNNSTSTGGNTATTQQPQAVIAINETQIMQQMVGFGASLTDSAALVLSQLNSTNHTAYTSLLATLFSPTSTTSAGLNYLRIPLGATDLSASSYTYDDYAGDAVTNGGAGTLGRFSIDNSTGAGGAPEYVFAVLSDILAVAGAGRVKVHLCPWSMPGWMKDSKSINGGNFMDSFADEFANYLFKSAQAWVAKGAPVAAISILNEPTNNNPTYPTALLDASTEASIALSLRALLDGDTSTSKIQIFGSESNWNDGSYPYQVMQGAESALAGVSFHCYSGTVDAQTDFHGAYPGAMVYQSECADIPGTDWWGDIKWMTSELWIGAPNNWASVAAMWSLAAEPNGDPLLPGTTSCGLGCRGVVSVSGGTWTANQEFYGLAHASIAITPHEETGGSWGHRIGSKVTIPSGSGNSVQSGALAVTAYLTNGTSHHPLPRYSLVVLNSNDGESSSGTGWNPQPIRAAITFRGMQAVYTFPVGLTTLWWYTN